MTTRPAVHVTIDDVVVAGLSAVEARAAVHALRTTLTALLADSAAHGAPPTALSIAPVRVGSSRPPTGQALGSAAARSIAEALGRPGGH